MNSRSSKPSHLEGDGEDVKEILDAIHLIDEFLLELQGFVPCNAFTCKRNFNMFIASSESESQNDSEE